VGKIGEQLVEVLCKAMGLDVKSSGDSEADLIIAGRRVEVKFSTLWESGHYKFQQIRDQNYEFAVCLGFSPFDVHCWVISKELLRQYVIGHTPPTHWKARHRHLLALLQANVSSGMVGGMRRPPCKSVRDHAGMAG
jgi:hypothetical protein